MSSTPVDNPAVLSLDIEEEQAPQGRSMAFKILIGLSIVGVAALVAVGIAVGVTAMTALHPTATSPLAFYSADATRAHASDSVISKAPNDHIIAKKRGKFALGPFRDAVSQGQTEFDLNLPGRDEPLTLVTTFFEEDKNLGSFTWHAKRKGSYEESYIILMPHGEVVGQIRTRLLRWTISGPADDVVIVEIDAANEEKSPIGSHDPAMPTLHSNISSPIDGHQRSINDRVVYDTMTIMLVFNRNGCTNTETTRVATITADIQAGWGLMNIPTPNIVWYCKRYHTSSINSIGDINPNQLYPDRQVLFSLAKNTDVAKRRVELGADLVLGIGGQTSSTNFKGAALTTWPMAELGFAWIDVNAGGTTVVHEIGHLMGMQHQQHVKLGDGSCPAADLGSCYYAGRGTYTPTNPDLVLYSIMDYGPLQSCGSQYYTGPAIEVAVYSGFTVPDFTYIGGALKDVHIGDTACDLSAGKYAYNRAWLELFYNVISRSYPNVAHTCPSGGDGCVANDNAWPALESTFEDGLYPIQASHQVDGKTYTIKNRASGKCLHASSKTLIKLVSCSTSNRQKWTLNHWSNPAIDGLWEDPLGWEDPYPDGVQRFTFKNKHYNKLLAPDNAGWYLEDVPLANSPFDTGAWALRIYQAPNANYDCGVYTPSYLALCGSSSTWFDRITGQNNQRWIFTEV